MLRRREDSVSQLSFAGKDALLVHSPADEALFRVEVGDAVREVFAGISVVRTNAEPNALRMLHDYGDRILLAVIDPAVSARRIDMRLADRAILAGTQNVVLFGPNLPHTERGYPEDTRIRMVQSERGYEQGYLSELRRIFTEILEQTTSGRQ